MDGAVPRVQEARLEEHYDADVPPGDDPARGHADAHGPRAEEVLGQIGLVGGLAGRYDPGVPRTGAESGRVLREEEEEEGHECG